jgi:hypothetical protein
MSNRRRLELLLRSKLRSAGRQYAEAREAYRNARTAAEFDLPVDDEGRARIVCRRYAERRAVEVDAGGRPDCFDSVSQDCQGCAEDIRDGRVETW